MCLRDRKEKLPSFEGGASTACREALCIDIFYGLESGVRLSMEMLLA
jgi:hypothetical protein